MLAVKYFLGKLLAWNRVFSYNFIDSGNESWASTKDLLWLSLLYNNFSVCSRSWHEIYSNIRASNCRTVNGLNFTYKKKRTCSDIFTITLTTITLSNADVNHCRRSIKKWTGLIAYLVLLSYKSSYINNNTGIFKLILTIFSCVSINNDWDANNPMHVNNK